MIASQYNGMSCFKGLTEMSKIVAISFYHRNTSTENEIQRLAASLIHHKIEFDIQAYPVHGSNIKLRPLFIFDMLLKHNDNLLFIDSGLTINKLPENLNCDIGVNRDKDGEPITDLMYISNNTAAKSVIEDWFIEQQNNDELVLGEILEQSNITVGSLNKENQYAAT